MRAWQGAAPSATAWQLSTLAPYTSWSSLTDRSYDARHLPPREIPALPPAEEVAELFRAPRRGPAVPQVNEIDLLPVYGVRPSRTEQLRAHDGGRLKSQNLDGAEFPLYLCSNGETKPECSQIKVVRPEQIPPERRDDPFAAGGDTMNSQLGFAVHERALVRHQLDGDRVQPALPLARPDPDRAPGRRNRRADLAHRVQPEAGGRARPGAAGR
jgi:prostaglandin-endoperoxide synthase 2